MNAVPLSIPKESFVALRPVEAERIVEEYEPGLYVRNVFLDAFPAFAESILRARHLLHDQGFLSLKRERKRIAQSARRRPVTLTPKNFVPAFFVLFWPRFRPEDKASH